MLRQAVPYITPRYPTEERLRCEAYRLLVNAGYHVDAQYPVPLIPDGRQRTWRQERHSGLNRGYLDLVIVADGQLVGIIETKKSVWTMEEWAATRQGQSYLALGVPVFLLFDMEQLPELLEWANARL